jgi:hypothetical protein
MALFPLGILSAAAGGVAFESDYELITTQILGSNQSSITFSSLGDYSSTYKHLQIRYTARSTTADTDDIVQLELNGTGVGTSQRNHELRGNGSVVASADQTALFRFGYVSAGNSTANSFGAGIIDALDPYSTTKNKTFRSLNGMTSANFITLSSLLWANTASITSIGVVCRLGSFVTGSRFSLYGIRG